MKLEFPYTSGAACRRLSLYKRIEVERGVVNWNFYIFKEHYMEHSNSPLLGVIVNGCSALGHEFHP